MKFWIKDCEDENKKHMNEWIFISLCMHNFKINKYSRWNFDMN